MLDRKIELSEKIDIINHFTQQLKNSGYQNDQIRDIVTSGLKGICRKEERKRNLEHRYKSSQETLEARQYKKLTESTSWYRDKKFDLEENSGKEVKTDKNIWNEGKRKKGGKRKDVRSMDVDGKPKIMSVVFVPHTEGSQLAKMWREKLTEFEKIGNIKLKIIERTGKKIEDLLHKSNSRSDQDCNRNDCLVCSSCSNEDKMGMCKRRNVVYETYCISCQEKLEKEKEMRELERMTSQNNPDIPAI